MEYPEAVHKFQSLHIWGPTTKAEIVEAVVNEAVRRTMEQVTGRQQQPKRDISHELDKVKDELGECEHDRDKALARVAELEQTIEGLREWAKELYDHSSREYDRLPFDDAWDASTRDRMQQLLARLHPSEWRVSFWRLPMSDRAAEVEEKLAEAWLERDALKGAIEGLRDWAEQEKEVARLGNGNPFYDGWVASTRDKMTILLNRLPAKEASDVTT